MLALITVAFSWQQDVRQQKAEERRAEVDRQIEEHRADDAALQAYLDQMGTLLIQRDLRHSTEDNATEDSAEARILARARTITVLRRLDASRKTEVMEFLVEAELVQGGKERDPIISLESADVSDADLSGANLRYADLSHADLSHADLSHADLSDANLSDANLRSRTNLIGADLSYADLSGTKGVTNEGLDQQAKSLEGATMPDGQKYEDWLKDREGSKEDADSD